jgi:hypothetical protein
MCAVIGANQHGEMGNSMDVEIALLNIGGGTYSLDDRSVKARRARKFQHCLRNQSHVRRFRLQQLPC